jgi:energy-converting hydrogenase B subunit D
MTVLQAIALIGVGLGGTALVLTRDPERQILVSSIFGLALALLFFCFQAPDVALSQIVVGGVALPAMIALALAKVRRRDRVARSGERA